MDFKISLELGPTYEVTYIDGSIIRFRILGGPNAEVHILGSADVESSTVPSLLQNFKSVVKVDE